MARGADTECSRIEIWDPDDESTNKPVVMLDTVGVLPTNLRLSTNNILAVSGDREYEEACSPDVKVCSYTVNFAVKIVCLPLLRDMDFAVVQNFNPRKEAVAYYST